MNVDACHPQTRGCSKLEQKVASASEPGLCKERGSGGPGGSVRAAQPLVGMLLSHKDGNTEKRRENNEERNDGLVVSAADK